MGARGLAVQNLFSLEREVVTLFGRGTGAGAAALTGVKGAGLAAATPIAETATGLYTITLADKWAGLLGFNANVIDATTPADWEIVVVSETVSTTKKINIAVFKAGLLADLTTDEKLLFEIVLSNAASKTHAGGGLAGY